MPTATKFLFAPFDRPLAIGDPEQVQAVQAMNGPDLYCPVCFDVPADYGRRARPGQSCFLCGVGCYAWGAGHKATNESEAQKS